MALTLYDFPTSGNARKVRLLLAELGLDFEHVPVPRARPRPDWYLELNPFGGVPAIRDGDLVLAESQAILRYLATREGRDDLYPADPARRARVDWALDAWTTGAFPRIFPLYRALVAETRDETGTPHPEQADPEKVERELPGAREGFGLYERFVADDGTVVGGGFTIADCACGPVLLTVSGWPFELEAEFPKLARIRAAVAARPSAAIL
ncbi:MAG TPA: glutathione S-transferase family protein [Gaiellaceae bacterium]|nr:glutathione S-transferase family protein [Gaiellaceae bacterium]